MKNGKHFYDKSDGTKRCSTETLVEIIQNRGYKDPAEFLNSKLNKILLLFKICRKSKEQKRNRDIIKSIDDPQKAPRYTCRNFVSKLKLLKAISTVNFIAGIILAPNS